MYRVAEDPLERAGTVLYHVLLVDGDVVIALGSFRFNANRFKGYALNDLHFRDHLACSRC